VPRPIAEQRLLGITSQARAVEIGGEVFLKVVVAGPRVPLGAGQPSTILGGVEELLAARQYPLAALVFFASIAVPMLKLFGLSVTLVTIQTGRAG
jgi:hypothetical protein